MKIGFASIILFFFICIIACQEEVTQEDLIRSAVEIRFRQWENEQRNECRQKAILNAEAYVDSMLIVNSLESNLDTIPKPPKPSKPFKPVFKTKPDSVIVDPNIKKDE